MSFGATILRLRQSTWLPAPVVGKWCLSAAHGADIGGLGRMGLQMNIVYSQDYQGNRREFFGAALAYNWPLFYYACVVTLQYMIVHPPHASLLKLRPSVGAGCCVVICSLLYKRSPCSVRSPRGKGETQASLRSNLPSRSTHSLSPSTFPVLRLAHCEMPVRKPRPQFDGNTFVAIFQEPTNGIYRSLPTTNAMRKDVTNWSRMSDRASVL